MWCSSDGRAPGGALPAIYLIPGRGRCSSRAPGHGQLAVRLYSYPAATCRIASGEAGPGGGDLVAIAGTPWYLCRPGRRCWRGGVVHLLSSISAPATSASSTPCCPAEATMGSVCTPGGRLLWRWPVLGGCSSGVGERTGALRLRRALGWQRGLVLQQRLITDEAAGDRGAAGQPRGSGPHEPGCAACWSPTSWCASASRSLRLRGVWCLRSSPPGVGSAVRWLTAVEMATAIVVYVPVAYFATARQEPLWWPPSLLHRVPLVLLYSGRWAGWWCLRAAGVRSSASPPASR